MMRQVKTVQTVNHKTTTDLTRTCKYFLWKHPVTIICCKNVFLNWDSAFTRRSLLSEAVVKTGTACYSPSFQVKCNFVICSLQSAFNRNLEVTDHTHREQEEQMVEVAAWRCGRMRRTLKSTRPETEKCVGQNTTFTRGVQTLNIQTYADRPQHITTEN